MPGTMTCAPWRPRGVAYPLAMPGESLSPAVPQAGKCKRRAPAPGSTRWPNIGRTGGGLFRSMLWAPSHLRHSKEFDMTGTSEKKPTALPLARPTRPPADTRGRSISSPSSNARLPTGWQSSGSVSKSGCKLRQPVRPTRQRGPSAARSPDAPARASLARRANVLPQRVRSYRLFHTKRAPGGTQARRKTVPRARGRIRIRI
jgi:hypothetical protein